ncbi:MAG: aminodeoxychorismate synthase component I [Acidobacteriota bacterium]|nr:aminodeoxychorismate synthase component I [Acidobacteriota bacterium]
MREIELSADRLAAMLLNLSKDESVCLLDSGGATNLDSRFLIAGIRPLETLEITDNDAEKTLAAFDEKLSDFNTASIFTISYDFGLKLHNLKPRLKELSTLPEPDIYLAQFDCLIVHDYRTAKTYLAGKAEKFDGIEKILFENQAAAEDNSSEQTPVYSNFTRESYIETVKEIQERIRRGDTYQTNLTQRLHARLPENLSPQKVFNNLRKAHPAAFAAFIKRENDCIVSASPERFFRIQSSRFKVQSSKFEIQDSLIAASPIKGTRPRGATAAEDLRLRNELLNSAKDRAENVMIVDLLRNDLGVICEYGSVRVEKLCDLETLPTLFHLVSTISGTLRQDIKISDVLRAVFPCGSITGAPKISTMRIIDELETVNRGLSMGAVGYSIPNTGFDVPNLSKFDLSVAIRTMVINNQEAAFNVGGGITIDSDAADEYAETLVKARALLDAINGKLI